MYFFLNYFFKTKNTKLENGLRYLLQKELIVKYAKGFFKCEISSYDIWICFFEIRSTLQLIILEEKPIYPKNVLF